MGCSPPSRATHLLYCSLGLSVGALAFLQQLDYLSETSLVGLPAGLHSPLYSLAARLAAWGEGTEVVTDQLVRPRGLPLSVESMWGES